MSVRSITHGVREILDAVLSAGRCALLSTPLSFLRVKSFSLSDSPNQHPRSDNPDRLLSGATSRLFPLGRFPCNSCFLLPSVCSEFGLRWGVHLRCVMRPLLPRGIDLLYPFSRARCLSASCATVNILLPFVLALDSKEMAVTLPVIILTYEFLKATRWADWKALRRWSWRYATPSLMAGAVTAIYLYGKVYGTGFRLMN